MSFFLDFPILNIKWFCSGPTFISQTGPKAQEPLSELVVDHIDGVIIIDPVSNVIFGIHGHKARP